MGPPLRLRAVRSPLSAVARLVRRRTVATATASTAAAAPPGLAPLGASGAPAPAPRRPLRAVVGLSGGVDSSVAALLLLHAGYDVRAVFMRNWDAAEEAGAGLAAAPCPADADYAAAAAAARHLGVPLAAADLSRAYWHDVFLPALAAYGAGRTPNPDAACNAAVKFGAFRAAALGELGGDVLATGHYAQLVPGVPGLPGGRPLPGDWPGDRPGAPGGGGAGGGGVRRLGSSALDRALHGSLGGALGGDTLEGPLGGPLGGSFVGLDVGLDGGLDGLLADEHTGARGAPPPRLAGGVDARKDQSDFLALVPREALRRVAFPLGAHTKAQVRALAAAAGLPTARRRESMGWCFVGPRRLGAFLGGYVPARPPARVVRVDTGERVGALAEPHALTPGQRARLPGRAEALYVAALAAQGEGAGTGAGAGAGLSAGAGAGGAGEAAATDVYVAPGEHHAALYCDAAAVWLNDVVGDLPPPLGARARGGDAIYEHVVDDADALARWLAAALPRDDGGGGGNAARAPSALDSGGGEPPAPTARVLWRDRHRAESLRGARALVVTARAWGGAAAALGARGGRPTAAAAAAAAASPGAPPPPPAAPATASPPAHDGGSGNGSGAALAGTFRSQHQQEGAQHLLLVLRFDAPARAVAAGQVLCVYEGDDARDGSTPPSAAAAAADADATDARRGGGGPPGRAPAAARVGHAEPQTLAPACRPDLAAPAPRPWRAWNGAGRELRAAGPIAAAGPSWWAQGARADGVPAEARQKAVGGEGDGGGGACGL